MKHFLSGSRVDYVAKVAETFGLGNGNAETLREFRYINAETLREFRYDKTETLREFRYDKKCFTA